MSRKHCWKRRNCSLRTISPFPTVFSKRLVLQTSKNQGLFGKGLTLYHTIPTLNDPEKEGFWKHFGKRRKCWLPAFSPFPKMFFILHPPPPQKKKKKKIQCLSCIDFVACYCFEFGLV